MSVIANIYSKLFAKSTHSHAIGDVTSLQSSIDSKANTTHTHSIAQVSDLQLSLDSKSNNGHTHAKSQITDFPSIPVLGSVSGTSGNFAYDLPNGMQVRWGTFEGSVDSDSITITFQSAFTTSCDVIVSNSTVASTSPHVVTNQSTTGCTISAAGAAANGGIVGTYIAIGR